MSDKPMSVTEGLRQVRELLATAARWTQHTGARSRSGEATSCLKPTAVCWCLDGALFRVTGGEDPYGQMKRLLTEVAGTPWISEWNDAPNRTHADVLALLDRAIPEEEQAG